MDNEFFGGAIIGTIVGVVIVTALLIFGGMPNIMEEHAEVFCNKNGQGLLDYKSDGWDFESITCGGKEENTVIKRNYKLEELNTYDVFMED